MSRIRPDTLKWACISAVSSKKVTKSVMRNRLKRRWANAFADALRSNGFHANGRSQEGPKDGKNYKPGLKGTLEILIFADSGLHLPYNDLVGGSNTIVKALRQHMQRLNLPQTQRDLEKERRKLDKFLQPRPFRLNMRNSDEQDRELHEFWGAQKTLYETVK
ncbi:uncharacterized protein Z518_01738 [Rhinocladiella mackenziei CBS 650.93]|uniref:Uncharacterized protein n=1 Tax=Rhinocladiella mackenziei CBS 650.93 TaxID=1442369 RepID=A0A0D2IXB1_9EURO|nr:uncharacterized protein Z518_01738 [Rhinocladiella mackenziei CBS 650.93]KIX10654.1 hypothetical protein Z518_01738 [Rhinocladiella mackenziei CBS 650.93]